MLMLLALALGAPLLGVAALAAAIALTPAVPASLPSWPSLPYLYAAIVKSALQRKQPRAGKGKPIKVSLTAPVATDARRYAGFLRLAGFASVPKQVPLSYLFVEAFRLCMLALAHGDFPFPVLGAVLARNTSRQTRPIAADEALTYSVTIEPDYVQNDKGDTEINLVCTATDSTGAAVWNNTLTMIVINPKRQRGSGRQQPGTAAQEQAAPPARQLLAPLAVPANAGRAYGALSGDRNPIHLFSFTSALFGFKRPIAHAMYLVARLEAELANAGHTAPTFPAVLETEFKRPTLLPAKLQAVVMPDAVPALQCAVLSDKGDKDVIVGRLF